MFQVKLSEKCTFPQLSTVTDLIFQNIMLASDTCWFSILGHRIPDISYPAFGVYPATKHSLTALCQTIRQELSFLKAPIKLTSVSPGMVDTDILTAMNQEVISRLPKLGVSDVTDAVVYALSTPDTVRVSKFWSISREM